MILRQIRDSNTAMRTRSRLRWIILDGDKNGGTLEFLESNTHPLPQADTDECGNLLALSQVVRNHILVKAIDRVGVIRADTGCSRHDP